MLNVSVGTERIATLGYDTPYTRVIPTSVSIARIFEPSETLYVPTVEYYSQKTAPAIVRSGSNMIWTMCFGSVVCPRCGVKGSFKLFRGKKESRAWYARIDHWENEGFPHGKYSHYCYMGKRVNDHVRAITNNAIFHIDEEKRTVVKTMFEPEGGTII